MQYHWRQRWSHFGFCGKRRGGGASMPAAPEGWGRLGIMLLSEAAEKGRFPNAVAPPRGRTPQKAQRQDRCWSRAIYVSALSTLRSTSMFDMRCEEEAAVQPHSRARQEQLQLINNQLREEDDKWQDVSAGQGCGQRGGCPAQWVRGRLEQKIRWGG